MPQSDFWKHFARQYCKDGASTQWMCAEALYNLNGRNPSQLNMVCSTIWKFSFRHWTLFWTQTMLPLLFSHYPAGVSLKTAVHFGQEMKSGEYSCFFAETSWRFFSGKFRQYDYGRNENIARYGQPQPPDYDLSKVTCPVYIYYADNDWLVHKSVGYFIIVFNYK